MQHQYYSQRTGDNPHNSGLPLCKIIDIFASIFIELSDDGYFEEAFGYKDPDGSGSLGKVRDIPSQILLDVKKSNLWPISDHLDSYSESDLFDMIEFLYHHVSKPTGAEATLLTSREFTRTDFDRSEGRQEYREKIDQLLDRYKNKFVFTEQGEVWRRPEDGFEEILNADIPSEDKIIVDLINTAVRSFRKHGASCDDRRHAVTDLAGVLERLRKNIPTNIVTNADDDALFNIANNFAIRHKNDKQKTAYDKSIWLSWMFYFYLATIHVLLKSKDGRNDSEQEGIF